MPIGKKWSTASLSNVQTNVPQKGGVYELKNFGELIYIGRASDLQGRLMDHLNQRNPNKYRFKTAGFLKSPSRLEENHLTTYGSTKAETPPWNNRDPRK